MRYLITVLALASMAWSSVVYVTSAKNQGKHMRDGTAGSALRLDLAQDGSTDCLADLTDYAGSTDATADLTCAHTGAIIVDTYSQIWVEIEFERKAGTVVTMQCDTSNTSGARWSPIMREVDGVKTIREWTATQSVSGAITHNFEINAELIRCRAVVTSGTDDTVEFHVQIAK